jgi:hypothetical protein
LTVCTNTDKKTFTWRSRLKIKLLERLRSSKTKTVKAKYVVQAKFKVC